MRLAHEPHEGGFFVLGGVEVMLLWESIVPSYISRNWIAVVLGAQAMCERGLAAIYEMQDLPGVVDRGRRNADRASLGTLLRWAREDAIAPVATLGLVQTLCDRRKVLTHWKPPLDPGTIMRRMSDRVGLDHLDPLAKQEYLFSEDAGLAIDAVFSFCFGNQISMLQVVRRRRYVEPGGA
jgi:hypothetical protein